MNDEPVAWMSSVGGEFVYVGYEPAEGYLAIPLYTHPAKTEEFMAGDAICPSCGCKSLYKTARSEWCVTHKCLWQKDYDLTLTNEEIDLTGKTNEGILQLFYMIKGDVTGLQFKEALRDFARAILRKASE